jgi:protein tyrosine/serine phosphatase
MVMRKLRASDAVTAAGTVVVVGLVAAASWLLWLDRSNRLVWDHFDVVKPGILYRSGQLQLDQLETGLKRYQIKTLVNFQYPGKLVDSEAALARRLGVDYLNLPMPGDGSGHESQFREVLKALDDPSRQPVWIHCARGTCRTGAAVGLYRMERDGWTVEDVAAEMRRQAYRDGWLPGYVFGMVQERPFDDRFGPQVRFQSNRRDGAGTGDDRLVR